MKFNELLQTLEIPYKTEGHEHCRPGWIQLDCPFCSKGWGHFRLGYSLDGGFLNCWSCGPHRLIDTLVEATGLSYGRCKALLNDIEQPRFAPKERGHGKLVLPPGMDTLLQAHRSYLSRRGFAPSKIERLWGIKGFGPVGNFAWRIFIPIHYQGEVVSWTTRSIVDSGVRYLSAKPEQEAMNHKELLYGEDYCRHSVVVHEGPTDVWCTGPGAVATLGTGFSRAQVLKLSKYPVRGICFDNEPTAQKRARELCDMLESFPGETYNIILRSKDAGSASVEETNQLRSFLEQ